MHPSFDDNSQEIRPNDAPTQDVALVTLRRAGLRVTTARVETLNALRKQTGFIRPESLFKLWLEKRYSTLSTIYRTLTDLSKSGVILKSRDSEGRNIYAAISKGSEASIYLCLPDRPPIPLLNDALRSSIEEAASSIGINLGTQTLSIVATRSEKDNFS